METNEQKGHSGDAEFSEADGSVTQNENSGAGASQEICPECGAQELGRVTLVDGRGWLVNGFDNLFLALSLPVPIALMVEFFVLSSRQKKSPRTGIVYLCPSCSQYLYLCPRCRKTFATGTEAPRERYDLFTCAHCHTDVVAENTSTGPRGADTLGAGSWYSG